MDHATAAPPAIEEDLLELLEPTVYRDDLEGTEATLQLLQYVAAVSNDCVPSFTPPPPVATVPSSSARVGRRGGAPASQHQQTTSSQQLRSEAHRQMKEVDQLLSHHQQRSRSPQPRLHRGSAPRSPSPQRSTAAAAAAASLEDIVYGLQRKHRHLESVVQRLWAADVQRCHWAAVTIQKHVRRWLLWRRLGSNARRRLLFNRHKRLRGSPSPSAPSTAPTASMRQSRRLRRWTVFFGEST